MLHACRLIVFLLVMVPGCLAGQSDTTQLVTTGRANAKAQLSKPYVILISADGFRYDYARSFTASNLLRFGAQGAIAESMIPSYPSSTFPNHYSLATGMYPSHHGLVDNTFYDAARKSIYSMSDKKKVGDKEWYGGMPLWVLAEKQQMLSASFYWVGSEAPILGIRPTYYYAYSDHIAIGKRLKAVRDWLALPPEKRPHLITFYFPEVDHESHMHGPDSPETAAAVRLIDKSIGRLVSMTDSLKLPVNYIFVSDHGMAAADTTNRVMIPAVLTDTTVCTMTSGATMLMVYCKKNTDKNDLYQKLKSSAKDYDVYLSDATPASWHYNLKDDRYHRLGDIILATRYPRIFRTGRANYPGRHGYDPLAVKEMQATFIAWGPNIRKVGPISSFENVNVYPLVATLLGLNYDREIDGKISVLGKILK